MLTPNVSVMMDLLEVAAVCALLIKRKKKRVSRKYWVHPIISERLLCGSFYSLFTQLKEYPDKFFDYFRMLEEQFDHHLTKVGPFIRRQDTTMRKNVPVEDTMRLAVTLRKLQKVVRRKVARVNAAIENSGFHSRQLLPTTIVWSEKWARPQLLATFLWPPQKSCSCECFRRNVCILFLTIFCGGN